MAGELHQGPDAEGYDLHEGSAAEAYELHEGSEPEGYDLHEGPEPEGYALHEGSDPDPEAYDLFRRGSTFLQQNHPGQAVLLLERAAKLAPGKNSIREALARAYFQLARYDEAAELFRAIAEAVPTNDYAHFGLACSLVNLGRMQEARAHFRLAAAMRPEHAHYQDRLARCEMRLRRPAGGEEARS